MDGYINKINYIHIIWNYNDTNTKTYRQLRGGRRIMEGCGKEMEVSYDSEHPEKGGQIVKCQKGWICSDCGKLKEAIKEMKENFPKTWGMTYEEFEKRISSPGMIILVKELRKKFDVNVLTDETGGKE